MVVGVLVLALALPAFLLPGVLVTPWAGHELPRPLLWFSASYVIMILSLALFEELGLGLWSWQVFIAVLATAGAVVATLRRLRTASRSPLRRNLMDSRVAGAACLVAANTLYLAWAGPYLEVPADVLFHLGEVQEQLLRFERVQEAGFSLLTTIASKNGYWYFVAALLLDMSGLPPFTFAAVLTWLTTTVFLLAVYGFSLALFRHFAEDGIRPLAAALVATVLVFLHFGVNVFSFVRYYALAPVMLNFVLYLTFVLVVLHFFEATRWRIPLLAIGVLLVPTMYLIHKQEALFAGAMLFSLALYYFLRRNGDAIVRLWRGQRLDQGQGTWRWLLRRENTVFILLIVSAGAAFLYSLSHSDRNSVRMPILIPIESIVPFVRNLYILNPTYQFYQTVTHWGVVVIVLFLVHWSRFRRSPFLVAGMISPLVTVFNPVFVDLFLRQSGSSTVLWRLSLLVPLAWVGALLLVRAWRRITASDATVVHRIGHVLVVALLLVTLLPLEGRYVKAPYSRLTTLLPVAESNSAQHWADLIDYLNALPRREHLLTDAVTGYLVAAFTPHIYRGYKFHSTGNVLRNEDYLDERSLNRWSGYLLVINRRSGGPSLNGRLSRHWMENTLDMPAHYRQPLLDRIAASPGQFERLWTAGDIEVYRIHRTPNPQRNTDLGALDR